MKWSTTQTLCYLLLCTVLIAACHKKKHTNEEVEQALNNYDSLIVTQNAAAIAQAFTPDGKFADMATGREAIKQLLSKVNKFKVIEQSSVSNTLQIRGDSALQTGTYFQRNVNANKDTVKAMGTFTCKWKWIDGEGWKIAHIVGRPF